MWLVFCLALVGLLYVLVWLLIDYWAFVRRGEQEGPHQDSWTEDDLL